MSFNLPLQPSDFHLQHVSLSKTISLHTISNLIILSHLSFFFLITKFLGKVIIFKSFSPSYSPISFSQKEPVSSNWSILFKILENLRFLQESLCSAILFIWYGSCPICLSVFPSFDILDFAWHFLPVFSAISFSPFHFLFFVIVPSYINVGIPMFYAHPQAVSWLCSWGISNSPMISTKQTEQLFLHISGLKHHCSRCWCAFQIAKHLHPGPSPAS